MSDEEKELDPKAAEDLKSLVFDGRLEATVDWMGHKVQLQLVSTKEESWISNHPNMVPFKGKPLSSIDEKGNLSHEPDALRERTKLVLACAVKKIDKKKINPEDFLKELDELTVLQLYSLSSEYRNLEDREAEALVPGQLKNSSTTPHPDSDGS